MSTGSEELSNIQINNKIEKKCVTKMPCIKVRSISISLNYIITNNNNNKNSFIKDSIENKISKTKRSLTSILIISERKIFKIKRKFFLEKEDNSFDLLFFTENNKIKENKVNKRNEGNKEIIESIRNKIEIDENRIEIKQKKIEANEKKIEIIEDKIETKKEATKKNVNNIEINDVNKNNYLGNIDNCNVNTNIKIKLKKKIDNDNYTQTYTRNDFSERPPNISPLFIGNYNYENKNIFSHSNNTGGNIKESKKIPNNFYNHLLINNEKNERYITTSLNKNNRGKLSTFIFYAPRTIYA